jgi:hypothetical protein
MSSIGPINAQHNLSTLPAMVAIVVMVVMRWRPMSHLNHNLRVRLRWRTKAGKHK